MFTDSRFVAQKFPRFFARSQTVRLAQYRSQPVKMYRVNEPTFGSLLNEKGVSRRSHAILTRKEHGFRIRTLL